jgi:hypothetical protein
LGRSEDDSMEFELPAGEYAVSGDAAAAGPPLCSGIREPQRFAIRDLIDGVGRGRTQFGLEPAMEPAGADHGSHRQAAELVKLPECSQKHCTKNYRPRGVLDIYLECVSQLEVAAACEKVPYLPLF